MTSNTSRVTMRESPKTSKQTHGELTKEAPNYVTKHKFL